MGAKISGVGTHILSIEGSKELHSTNHQIIPDQIEAGTFALAMAATSGFGIINDFIVNHHDILLKKMQEANINFKSSLINLSRLNKLQILSLLRLELIFIPVFN